MAREVARATLTGVVVHAEDASHADGGSEHPKGLEQQLARAHAACTTREVAIQQRGTGTWQSMHRTDPRESLARPFAEREGERVEPAAVDEEAHHQFTLLHQPAGLIDREFETGANVVERRQRPSRLRCGGGGGPVLAVDQAVVGLDRVEALADAPARIEVGRLDRAEQARPVRERPGERRAARTQHPLAKPAAVTPEAAEEDDAVPPRAQ